MSDPTREALVAALRTIHSGPRPWPRAMSAEEMADSIRAALSTTPAPDLVDIVDRCRQHIAGLGADLSTIKAREATSAQRNAATERAYKHLRGIDNILTAALEEAPMSDNHGNHLGT